MDQIIICKNKKKIYLRFNIFSYDLNICFFNLLLTVGQNFIFPRTVQKLKIKIVVSRSILCNV